MENAADALKIAFAVFIFVIAITLTFSIVSQAKSTADAVFYYSDETNFYEYSDSSEKSRTVSVSEIIPTLYRYYKESIGVEIKLKNGLVYTFDLNNNESIMIENKTKLTSNAEREENLKRFIENVLFQYYTDAKFIEEFVEIPVSGIYEYRFRWYRVSSIIWR